MAAGKRRIYAGLLMGIATLLPNAIKVDWAKLAVQDAQIKEAFRSRVTDKL